MKANNTFFRTRMFPYIFPILLLLAFYQGVNAQTLVVPPSPGDLSSVEHLKQSDDYTVEVKKSGDANYTTCFVYKTDNYWVDTYHNSVPKTPNSASFTNVSFSGTAIDVRVTCNFTASNVIIRPLNFGINAVRNGNVITFTLTEPKKISIEVNDRKRPLFLLTDTPDVPNTSATYYYGPGVHHIGLQKEIKSNESVYIAGGAVVEGSFVFPWMTDNVNVRGRGILTMGEWSHQSMEVPWLGAHSAVKGNSITNSIFEGITIANSSGWTMPIYNSDGNKTYNNQIRNVKMISWNGNTDGIWVNGKNHVIDDCFIFNNDDIFMSHGASDCKISNIVAWGGPWGRFYWLSNQSSTSNILFENINVIGKDAGVAVILVDGESGTPITMDKITFRNIRIEAHPYTSSYNTNKFIIFNSGYKSVTNWLFEDVTIDDKNADEGDFYGTASSPINGITFRNLKIGGKFIGSLAEANMDKNAYASNINFDLALGMKVSQGGTFINNKTGIYDFGLVEKNTSKTVTFTIENKSELPLNLTGSPRVSVSGTGFSLISDAASSVINSGEFTSFQVKFTPNAAGKFNGTVSIANSDSQSNPYTFLLTGSEASSANLIANSTFDTDLTGWGGYREPSTSTANELVSRSGYSGKACKVNITNGGTVNWHVQLAYNFPIVEGKTYTISFKANADANRSINYSFQQNTGSKKVYTTSPNINLTTTPATYGPYTFTSTATDNDQSFRFHLGASNSSVYIDDVVITEVSTATAVKPTLNEKSGLKFFPNPVSDFLKIELAGVKAGKIGINLFDLNGRQLLEKVLQAPYVEGLTCELNVGQVKEGVYLLKVRTDESLMSGLVMVRR